MPVKELKQRPIPRREELLHALVAEWRSPSSTPDDSLPTVLVEEVRHSGTRHVYVVWKEWEGVSYEDRSELVMDACEQAKESEWTLKVVVAMGLTPEEAKRMRIEV
jgi:hypothetical protein